MVNMRNDAEIPDILHRRKDNEWFVVEGLWLLRR
jgi:hypothetical protein